MTISAIIVADSVARQGKRLTTMQLRYPRFIHSELMTHRVFSRNASSSRAIPVERLIADVMRDTAMPIHWGKNQKGMQAHEELDATERSRGRAMWRTARNRAIEQAERLHGLGAHKQIVNRLLEPFSHINVVITATAWDNFFALRRHPDAQPEIHALADRMFEAMADSEPVPLKAGEWHVPYVLQSEKEQIYPGMATSTAIVKLSVARCARVSYFTHEGKPPNIAEDLALYERLVGGVPLHASPAEHQARPDTFVHWGWENVELHGNFEGWIQFRKELEVQMESRSAT